VPRAGSSQQLECPSVPGGGFLVGEQIEAALGGLHRAVDGPIVRYAQGAAQEVMGEFWEPRVPVTLLDDVGDLVVRRRPRRQA